MSGFKAYMTVIYMHMPCMINRDWGLKQHGLFSVVFCDI